MYIGTFWGKLFSFRKIHHIFRGFRNLSCKSVDVWRKVFASVGVVKIAFSVAKESFLMRKKTILFDKVYIHLLWNLGVFFVLLPTVLRQACQKFIVHVQMNIFTNRFLGNLASFSSFPEFEQKVFGVSTRKFRQGRHNCILHVHRNILRKVIFFEKFIFFYVVFGIWPAILWIFREIFLLASSKMHSPLLENHFWWRK